MPFQIVRNDITKMQVDAIVNAAKPTLLGGGGVDGAIHAAAGPELLEECKTLGGCEVGQAKITAAYGLPCRYVIHTVGPKWHGGLFGERRLLASCYRSALMLAQAHECESIAFPLISSGAYGYPKEKAIQVAIDSISDFLFEHDMIVFLVLYGQESLDIGHKLFAEIQEYIDNHYVEQRLPLGNRRRDRNELQESVALNAAAPQLDWDAMPTPQATKPAPTARPKAAKRPVFEAPEAVQATTAALDGLFFDLDESFQQMLLRKIDERGMTDAQCYKKANIDRKLFSKIRKDTYYKPSKPTVIAFAIALELDLRETESLLRKTGYALSRSSKFDVIIQYFIEHRSYNIFEINEVLFHYDQSPLGG